MTQKITYYTILGIAEDADEETIRAAYRRCAKEYHPDVCDHPDAAEHFKSIDNAWKCLGDTEKRREYDNALRRMSSQERAPRPSPERTPRSEPASSARYQPPSSSSHEHRGQWQSPHTVDWIAIGVKSVVIVWLAVMIVIGLFALLSGRDSHSLDSYKSDDTDRSTAAHEETIAVCKKAIAINPDNAEAYYNMGVAYGKLWQYADAIVAYKKAIAINPDYADAYHRMSVIYHRMSVIYDNRGNHLDALVAREEAIAIERKGKATDMSLDLGKGVRMKLALIPAGKFMMGSPKTETGRDHDEGPQRNVTISTPFYMGTHEVTQSQWCAVFGTEPWDGKEYAKSSDNNAASYISWDDAIKFCESLSKRTGHKVSLPTEAQWEYSCRAGSKTAYSFGNDSSKLGDCAWYYENAWSMREQYAHAVGWKKANAFGLYDMHGNVWEWCRDWYDEKFYANAENVDPENTTKASYRVLRGASVSNRSGFCRSARRSKGFPHSSYYGFGFRVVVELGSGVD